MIRWVLWMMLWAGSVQAAPPVKPPPLAGASAAIAPTLAEFRVPVRPQETWAWNLGAPDVREYAWLVEISGPTGPVRMGVQIWHEPGASPTTGSLAQLIASGQTGFWPADQTDGAALEDRPVTAVAGADHVILKVTDEVTLAWLQHLRPGTVQLVTMRGHGPHPSQRFEREWRQAISVIYAD